MDLASEKGASNWLTAFTSIGAWLYLTQRSFHDALVLRYGWTSSNLPSKCECGKSFSALSCAKGGFPTIRHNEIRNLTASLLTEVCSNVRNELNCGQSPMRYYQVPLLIHKMQGLTFLQVVSGEGASKQPILMYVFSTLMNRSMSLTACKNMREKRKEHMSNVFRR